MSEPKVETILHNFCNVICNDCGKRGCVVAHNGPMVPKGKTGYFCKDCWNSRVDGYRLGLGIDDFKYSCSESDSFPSIFRGMLKEARDPNSKMDGNLRKLILMANIFFEEQGKDLKKMIKKRMAENPQSLKPEAVEILNKDYLEILDLNFFEEMLEVANEDVAPPDIHDQDGESGD